MTPRKQVAAILARLSFHYWRPDYSQEQARMVMEDYLNDLEHISPASVEKACAEYRKKPDSKFFPKVGEILDLIAGPKWLQEPERRLPRYDPAQYQLAGPPAKFRSVAEVLREHGSIVAAEKWEVRISSSPKGGSPT